MTSEVDPYPFAGPDVQSRQRLPSKSGLADWIDLMEAIEALCPKWPEREPVTQEGAVYKL